MLAKKPDTLKVLSPSNTDEIGNYSFGSKAISHRFCKNCGTSVYGHGYIEQIGGELLMINIYTIDGVDLSKLKPVKYWDGLSIDWEKGPVLKGPLKEPAKPGCW